MVPLFTPAIPGPPTMALLLFVFTMYGLQPGPQLMQNDSTLIWAIIASMYVGNVVLLLLNLPFVGLFVKLLKIPDTMLYSGVLTFVVLGAYTLGFDVFSMGFVIVFGAVGYAMQKFDIPLAPAVLGLVLEPLIETALRRALQISGGDPTTFVDSTLAKVLTVVILLILATPLVLMVLRRRGRDLGMLGEALEGADESDHPSLAAQTSDASSDVTSTTVPPGPSSPADRGPSERPRG